MVQYSLSPKAIIAIVLVTVLSVAAAGCSRPQAPVPTGMAEPIPEPSPAGETLTLRLHFVHNGRDEVELRSIPSTVAVARAAVGELSRGSLKTHRGHKVLPPGTCLKDITILDGIAYVDFSREFRDNHWGGLASELDTIYSVANTLGEFESIQAVQFLLEGSSLETIGAGAIDLTTPVRPQPVTPELYHRLGEQLAEAAEAAEDSWPWSYWLAQEERIGLREGFPDQVLTGDLDGDGVHELIFTHDKQVSVWKRRSRGFEQIWTQKFYSKPRIQLAAVDQGQSLHLIVGTEEGLYIFVEKDGSLDQLGWQGIGGSLVDIAAGDTTGNGRGQILALIGADGPGRDQLESASIIIWEWNGDTYFKKGEVDFNARQILLADLSATGSDDILAFNHDGLTVFSWQQGAYVETASNLGIGSSYASALAADVTGDGQLELIFRDGHSPSLYVYTWQEGVLRKLWQSSSATASLGWDVFAGTDADKNPILISPTSEPGRYAIYQYSPEGWTERIISGSGDEEILAVADIDGDGKAEVIFRRWQLLSNPIKWVFVGRPGL
ncbi:MAG: hypothetical protein GX952_01610 [Firmicutes bacterium]|nr:hypothetical protein [Bacillota bacterium]